MGLLSRAKKKVSDWGKRVRKQVREFDTDAKRIGRKGATVAAKAQPYVTGVVAGGLTFVPGIGPVLAGAYTGIESAIAPYLGSTAARADGLSGRDAREAGRDQRRTVAIAGGAATVLGTVVNQLVPALFSSSPAPSTPSTAQNVKFVSDAVFQGSRDIGTGMAATLGGAPAASAPVGGSGVFGFLGDAGKFLLDTGLKLAPNAAQQFLGSTPPKQPAEGPGTYIEVGGAAGGAGGSALPSDPESVSDAFRSQMGLAGKLLFAGGAVAALYFGSKLLKKGKAA